MTRDLAERMTGRAPVAELVAIDSTSALSNAPMVELLEPKLAAMGFAGASTRYADAPGWRSSNLVAARAPMAIRRRPALVGHTDCVPYDAGWKEALQPR